MVLGTPGASGRMPPVEWLSGRPCRPRSNGSLGPGVLGALPGAAPGGREEPGRDAQSRIGAFQGGKDGFLSSGSKGSTLASGDQLLAPSYPHTAVVLCAFCPPDIKLHRCWLLAPAPLLGALFLSHPFPSVSLGLLLPPGESGSNGDSLSCTEGESGALPAHPFGVAGRTATLAVSGAIVGHGNDK